MGRLRSVAAGLALAALLVAAPGARAAHQPVPCTDWPAAISYDRVNAGGPDPQASYWALGYAGVPGGRLVVHGAYPDARYFSLTAQDETETTLGSLRDENLLPDAGSGDNPFTVDTTD